MIKRSLYFGNPAYLSRSNEQLIVRLPEVEKNSTLPESFKNKAFTSIAIEDIGIIILDCQQITITQGLLAALLDNNVAVITCADNHLPSGLLLPLAVNSLQNERFRDQLDASQPLRKQLWAQTITVKIENQAALLRAEGHNVDNMMYWAESVRSGDPDNYESRAAAYFWKTIFPPELKFIRDRNGFPPNNLLNYGYAIIRAIVARSLVGSGLLPTFGIHHANKYNAYCLADDIMEPYRAYVDRIVVSIVKTNENYQELTTELKKRFLELPAMDVIIDGERSPLMIATQRSTASLAKCFGGTTRKIMYPTFI